MNWLSKTVLPVRSLNGWSLWPVLTVNLPMNWQWKTVTLAPSWNGWPLWLVKQVLPVITVSLLMSWLLSMAIPVPKSSG